ncbi:MAG: hypothetical protein GY858_02415 [Candidatus Omnitrophica bacterium]|nr:hypothetical protein [Candidatus Omnitrophota bacterium]
MVNNQDKIKIAVQNILNDCDVELIEFKSFFGQGQYIVRCVVDCPGGGILIDDCSRVNKKVTNFLNESGLLGEKFCVEVNSPGLDRKLKGYDDFKRALRRQMGLWLETAVDGKEYVEGEIIAVNKEFLSIKIKEKTVDINFSEIKVGKEKIK